MRSAKIVLKLALFVFSIKFANAQKYELTLNVTAVRNISGQVLVTIYKSDKGFPDDHTHAIYFKNVTIKGNKMRVDVGDLSPGKYAAVAVHDENNNARLDANIVGYPIEGIAVSDGIKSKLRKPKFAESAFTLSASTTVELKMNYY